jgi:hypothetical protein
MDQIELHKKIDELLSQGPAEIKREDVLLLISENKDAQQYLYAKAGSNWLEWFYKNNFLDILKEKPEKPATNGFIPELDFLVRAASENPKKVVDIILDTEVSSENFNPVVVNAFLRIVAGLQKEYLPSIVSNIDKDGWVRLMSGFYNWGFEYEKMFETLKNAGDYASLIKLAKAVLSIKTKEELGEKGLGFGNSPFYLKDLSYTKVFEFLSSVTDEYLEPALKVATDTMSDIMRLEDKAQKGEAFEIAESYHLLDVDFFSLELNNKEVLSEREHIKSLAAVIKIISRRFIEKNCSDPKIVSDFYKEYIHAIPENRSIWRLKLYILTLCPEVFKDRLRGEFFRLFKTDDSYDILYGAEYKKALRECFYVLSEDDKKEYVKTVINYFTEKDKKKENEKQDWYIRYGSQILSVLYKYLGEERKIAEDLGFTIDPNYEPEPSIGKIRGGAIISKGAVTKEEFTKMSLVEIAEKLRKDWTPGELNKKNKGEDDFLRPLNAEGVGDQIKENIPTRLQEYIDNSGLFFEPGVLDQHYTYSFLRGIQDTIKGNKEEVSKINWDNFINFCLAVKEKSPFESGKRDRNSFDAWLANWTAVHSALVDVLMVLLRDDGVIQFVKYRDKFFAIISYLLHYQDPVPEDEKLETAKMKTGLAGKDQLVSDPFSMAINTVRGRSFELFVSFAYQDGKKFKKEDDIKIDKEVKDLYEEILSKENTRALMFMFGRYIATFYYRDKNWVIGLLPQIFPEEKKKEHLYTAAWEGYLSENLYKEIFDDKNFQKLYERGLSLESGDSQQKHFKEPDEGIAVHFALAFIYFKGFEFGQPLFDAFWNKDNPEQQADFVSFIGRNFISGDNVQAKNLLETDPEAKRKIRNFWDWALKKYPQDYKIFTEFGYWIDTEKNVFELAWLAEHIEKTLEKTRGKISWDYKLMRSIGKLANAAPKETLEIARLYLFEGGLKGDNSRLSFYLDNEWLEALKILYNKPETSDGVYKLVNDLIREGGNMFWTLKEAIKKDK